MKLSLRKMLEYATPGPSTLNHPSDLDSKSDLKWHAEEDEEDLYIEPNNEQENKNEGLTLLSLYEGITDENKKNKMVALYIPSEVGKQMQSLFKDEDGERVEPEDMHITIGLVRSEDDKKAFKALQDASRQLSPFSLDIDEFDVFEPSDSNHGKHILHAKPKSEQLERIHKAVFDKFEENGLEIDNGDFPFNPHITVKYCDNPPNTKDKKVKKTVNLDKLYYVPTKERYPVPMGR